MSTLSDTARLQFYYELGKGLPRANVSPDRERILVTAIEAFNRLNPGDAWEGRLAAQSVLAAACAADCMEESEYCKADFAKMARCRAQGTSLMRTALATRRMLLQEQKRRLGVQAVAAGAAQPAMAAPAMPQASSVAAPPPVAVASSAAAAASPVAAASPSAAAAVPPVAVAAPAAAAAPQATTPWPKTAQPQAASAPGAAAPLLHSPAPEAPLPAQPRPAITTTPPITIPPAVTSPAARATPATNVAAQPTPATNAAAITTAPANVIPATRPAPASDVTPAVRPETLVAARTFLRQHPAVAARIRSDHGITQKCRSRWQAVLPADPAVIQALIRTPRKLLVAARPSDTLPIAA